MQNPWQNVWKRLERACLEGVTVRTTSWMMKVVYVDGKLLQKEFDYCFAPTIKVAKLVTGIR